MPLQLPQTLPSGYPNPVDLRASDFDPSRERLRNFLLEPLPQVLDASALTVLMACPRKFLFSKINRLVLPAHSVHLVAGGAFAAGLEMYRRQTYLHDADHSDAMMRAFVAAAEAWGHFGHDPQKTGTKPFTSVCRALCAYASHFPPRSDYLRPQFNRLHGDPSVEFSFSLPLDDFPHHPNGDPFVLAGRFDMLAIHTELGYLVGVDEKTTYSFGPSWSERWQLRYQFLTYIFALRRLGYDVNHFLVRGVAMLKTRTDFLEVPLTFPPHLITEYEENLKFLLGMLTSMNEAGVFPPYYGDQCARCDFRPLCYNRSADNWRSLYNIDTWDPLRPRDWEGEGAAD